MPVKHIELKTTIGWIAVEFATDYQGPQRMNPNDFVDPLIYSLVLQASHGFYFSCSGKYLNIY